ncbi:phytoene desaturase family protein [Spirochaeta africana]|uniref:Phytoene desaturase n=1 Tax=Spirochaeta africana (strain ATCC 700263 / DSM 8902 / Z-7692) TaxID=889378 RepID=H9UMT1_SPIAZ|nr:phytoene desaturase family protein [Spirochaeta africana]AFG38824.1 phytoene desaturase [Spirochaeta africana DSM 8902]
MGNVVVIGGGIGGLTAAAYAAHAGHSVTLFESQPGPGGKALSLQQAGYRFDTGPSVFTMQDVFATVFSELDQDFSSLLSPVPLDPGFCYWWPDGSTLRLSPGEEALLAGAEQLGIPRAQTAAYIASCRKIYHATHELFLWRSLHSLSTYRTRVFWRSLMQIGRIKALRSMHAVNARFFSDSRMQQFADRYATYNGSSPYRTPATMNIISYVENILGAMSLDGGTVQLPLALEKTARKLGVDLRYSSPVDEIMTVPHKRTWFGLGRTRHRVTGVRSGGRIYPADVVISNADVEPTYKYLLQDPAAPELKRYLNQEPSSSVIVWYLGIAARFSQLSVNNIFFSGDYHREFSQIFDGKLPDDPTLYLNITSKVTPQDAPPYGENWFVLVNTPPDNGQDWDSLATRVYDHIIQRMSAELGQDITPLIEFAEPLTPRDIQTRTGSRQGSIYGIASNTRTAAFSRHPNRSRRYAGLYFCGGSVHPGGGMPMVVLSGRIAASLIAQDFHRGRLGNYH